MWPETGRTGDGGGRAGDHPGAPSGGAKRRLPQAGAAEVVVDAAPEAVWAVLADVTRIGEWSHECRGAEWLDGATAAAPGVRFRGRNKVGALVRWARVCVIRAVDAPHELVWETVGPPLMRDASLWRVRLDPVDGGTRIRQEFRILSMAAWADRAVAAVIPAHRDRIAALEADLRRLGEVARVSAGGRRTS
ncbi:MAG TPA: SRPBCC family protein [Pseudonocardia sp.]|nr:SRPBCC family protein [Pseudonocardia sp.]